MIKYLGCSAGSCQMSGLGMIERSIQAGNMEIDIFLKLVPIDHAIEKRNPQARSYIDLYIRFHGLFSNHTPAFIHYFSAA